MAVRADILKYAMYFSGGTIASLIAWHFFLYGVIVGHSVKGADASDKLKIHHARPSDVRLCGDVLRRHPLKTELDLTSLVNKGLLQENIVLEHIHDSLKTLLSISKQLVQAGPNAPAKLLSDFSQNMEKAKDLLSDHARIERGFKLAAATFKFDSGIPPRERCYLAAAQMRFPPIRSISQTISQR